MSSVFVCFSFCLLPRLLELACVHLLSHGGNSGRFIAVVFIPGPGEPQGPLVSVFFRLQQPVQTQETG